MKTALNFIRTHWFTLGLLFIAIVAVGWVVNTQRAPGSMTPIEAQAMDMTMMKPPRGVFPVAVEEAAVRDVGGAEIFPATIQAYSDEDVVARIPGRVVEVPVYPGNRVSRGQLIARLEADEFAAQQAEARSLAGASGYMAEVSRREIERLRSSRSRLLAEQRAMAAAVSRADAERDVAASEAASARQEFEAKESAVAAVAAELRFAEQNLERERRLYRAGAVSLQDLQAAESGRDKLYATYKSAQAEASSAKRAADAAERRVTASEAMFREAEQRRQVSEEAIQEADKEIAKAEAESKARQAEARASGSAASASSIIAGYRQLRALADAMVSERAVSPGSLVMPGDVVVRLKVIDRVRVQAQLPERLAPVIRIGSKVEIRSGSVVRHAIVTSAFPVIDSATRTFTAEALADNTDHELLPGMFAQLIVQTTRSEQVVSVRSSSVLRDPDGKHYVWVMSDPPRAGAPTKWTCPMHPEINEPKPGDCPICGMSLVPRERTGDPIAIRRDVTIGATDGRYTAILSGVSSGDRVIWAGFADLYERAPVQQVEWGEDGPKTLPPASAGPTGHEGH